MFNSTFTTAGFCCLIALCTIEAGEPPPHYYDSAAGKQRLALRQALHGIIKGHRVIRYDTAVQALDVIDQDQADTNNVILVYSTWSVRKDSYPAWNREHLWPQSYGVGGGNSFPPLADLFNLRPCDSRANSARGNKYFDNSDPLDRNYNPSAFPTAPLCSADTDSWEPPDCLKGDIARAILYMDLRYDGDLPGEPDLMVTDNVALINSTNSYMGRLSTLLLWSRFDRVDAAEERRNDLIFTDFQHNRNPFVDHPEWVDDIYLPALTIAALTNGFKISWPPDWPDAVLQSTKTVSAAWANVPNSTTNLDGQVAVFLSSSNADQFFRLKVR